MPSKLQLFLLILLQTVKAISEASCTPDDSMSDNELPPESNDCFQERESVSANSGDDDKNGTTFYSAEVTEVHARDIVEMHWLHDGHKATVLSQLEAVHRSSALPPSKMKVIDIACGEGLYARDLSQRFGYERIVGVEQSQFQVDLAKNRTTSIYPNVEYHQMDVPSDADISKLGGPFDIALVNWLYPYADSKGELLDMMRWTNRVMKPGGALIGWTVGIEDIRDADHGVVKDPKFRVEQRFDGKKKEGRIHQRENEMRFDCSIYTLSTYRTLFDVAGFEDVHFLEPLDYVDGRNQSSSSREERAMFEELITWKGCILKAMRATKL